jgi:hypothetical protein
MMLLQKRKRSFVAPPSPSKAYGESWAARKGNPSNAFPRLLFQTPGLFLLIH